MKIRRWIESLCSASVRRKAKQVMAVVLTVLMVNSIIDYSGIISAYAQNQIDTKTITGFAKLSDDITYQKIPVGAEEASINLPNKLTVIVKGTADKEDVATGAAINKVSIATASALEGATVTPGLTEKDQASSEQTSSDQTSLDQTTTEEITLEHITWKIDTENSTAGTFTSDKNGTTFIYIPSLPEGYAVADGVELPKIKVQIGEKVPQWAFKRSKNIDGIEITVMAEEGVFPKNAILHAKKVTSDSDTQKIQSAVAKEVKAEDAQGKVEDIISFDITITDSEGNEIQSDTNKGEVKVAFAELPLEAEKTGGEAALKISHEIQVFHMDDVQDSAKKLETKVDDMTGTVEANAKHFSIYPVAFLTSSQTTYDITKGSLTINNENLKTYQNAIVTGTTDTNMITINGVNANLTISKLNINIASDSSTIKGWMSAIQLTNGATLNLTITGDNTVSAGMQHAAINVPAGCSLVIMKDSSGTLTATAGSGAAGIGADFGGYSDVDTQTLGNITINGGTVKAFGKGAGAGIGGTMFGKTGNIVINGGTVYANGGGGVLSGTFKAVCGAGIGGGADGYVENISITGGSVTAVGGHIHLSIGSFKDAPGAGIGCGSSTGITSDGKFTCGTISIIGGVVSATGGNNNAVNAIGYGMSSAFDISGDNFAGSVTISDSASVNTNGGAIHPLSNTGSINTYKLAMTIYDGRLAKTMEGASINVNGKTYGSDIMVNEKYVGTISCSLVYPGVLTGKQSVEISSGGYSWSTSIDFTEGNLDYTASIGSKLYPVSLYFYDAAITSDIAGVGLSVKQDSTVLNSNAAEGIVQLVCDGTITKQKDSIGKITAYMPAGSSSELTATVPGVNGEKAITVSGKTIYASSTGTTIILWDKSGTEQLSGTLDLSYGNITFADNGGKLDITYTPKNGETAKTVTGQYYQNEYEIIQSDSTATTNKIIIQNTSNFVNIKLNGVNMKSGGKAIDLQLAKAKLNLSGTNIIDCGGGAYNSGDAAYYMGIHAASGSELTIDGNGSLEIKNPSDKGAGIGGYSNNSIKYYEGAGTIRIQGGSLKVSGKQGAAIGSGFYYLGDDIGSIYITGGTVDAGSYDDGAAIGGSAYGKPSNVYISGGTVTASSSSQGAAIGGGYYSGYDSYNGNYILSGGKVVISGGYVEAQATYFKTTAIGGGYSGACPDISISGGTIKATGCVASIGTSKDGVGGSLKITGGTICTINNGKPTINLAPTNDGTTRVYYTTADVSDIYGKTASVKNASITGYDYGFQDISTDANGVLHLYLPANAAGTKTKASFNDVNYEGTVTTGDSNVLKKLIQLAVEANTVTSTGATLHALSESSDTVYYAASSTNLTTGSEVEHASGVQSMTLSGGSGSAVLTGLKEGTAYTYYLVAKTGNDYSDVVSVTFTTAKAQLELSGSLMALGTYGQTLSAIIPVLSGGSKVQTTSGNVVEGSWSFDAIQSGNNSDTIYPVVDGTAGYQATFTSSAGAGSYGNILKVTVIPAITYLSVADGIAANLADTNKCSNGSDWYIGDVTVNAPEGYYISTSQEVATFGTATALTIKGATDSLTYYLRDKSTKGITAVKTVTGIRIDKIAPIIDTTKITYQQGTNNIFVNAWNWIIGKELITVTVPITEDGSGLSEDNVTVTLTQDSQSSLTGDVKAESKLLSGNQTKGYILSFTIPEGFSGTYTVSATDTVGKNVTTTSQPVSGRIVVDTKAPEVTLTPSGTAFKDGGTDIYTGTVKVGISAADKETSSGLKSVTCSIDNGNAIALTPAEFESTKTTSFTKADSVSVSAAGTHTVSVTVTDQAGNSTTKSVTFKIYGEPVVTITPASTVTYDGSAIEEGNGKDFTLDKGSSAGAVTYYYKTKGAKDSTYVSGLPTNAGSYTIKAKIAKDDTNYLEEKEATGDITIGKAEAKGLTTSFTKNYSYAKGSDKEQSISLAALLPSDKGTVNYTLGTETDSNKILTASVKDGKLNYTVSTQPTTGATASVDVNAVMTNYKDVKFTLTVKLTDKTVVVQKSGAEVAILGSSILTYGSKLETLNLNTSKAKFVEEGTSTEVSGILSWKTPALVPSAGTTAATWVFTPADIGTYTSLEGTVPITVDDSYTIKVTNGVARINGQSIIKTNEGQLVTITADAAPEGKEFAGWTITGASLKDAKSMTTTFVMGTADVSVTATYKSKPSGGTNNGDSGSGNGNSPIAPSVPQTDLPKTEDKKPYIKDNKGKEGWDAIETQTEQAKAGDTLIVEMNGSTVVPKEALGAVRGKDITLIFDMGDGTTWSVNGKSIMDNGPKDIDFSVKRDTDTIPVDVINNVTGERYSRNISLSHDGEFGFQAVLSINMEKNNAGLYANLFYYNPASNQLELQSIGQINENGYAKFMFPHASDYVIAISTQPMVEKAIDQITLRTEKGVLYIGRTNKKSMTLGLDIPDFVKKAIKDKACKFKITYKSSNPKIATVTSSGKVVAKKLGKTTITTMVKINGVQKSFKTIIQVKKASIGNTIAKSVGTNYIIARVDDIEVKNKLKVSKI